MQIELSDEDHKLVSEILIETFLNAILKDALKDDLPQFCISFKYGENEYEVPLTAFTQEIAEDKLIAIKENGIIKAYENGK